jgi:hypothetical protein
MTRTFRRALFAAAAFAAAFEARAQFVQLTRCQAALPCALPFGLQYKPDPLIAGQWANASHTVFSGRIDLLRPLQPLVIDLSKEIDRQDFARDAARIFVLRHPAPRPKPAADPDPARPAKD